MKPNGSICICGDYKSTINKVSKLDVYPLPRTEDILANLSGGVSFSTLDLSHAYNQVELDLDSQKYLTINTHKGLYTYKRLPFGIKSAPSIFQRLMENLLQGLPHVSVYIDNIIITGKTQAEHLQNLESVLSRLKSAGIRLKREKCTLMAPEVNYMYLGHKIGRNGIEPTWEKVQAITNAPVPKSVSELKAFLGLMNYYGKFLPSIATVLHPLYSLLQKDTKWIWSAEQEKAFQASKDLLKSPKVLTHYDSKQDLILTCDASQYGIGAVLSHRFEKNQERPVAFASRTLSATEQRYSQLDKEALAIIFGIRKFHQYVAGRQFEIHTDHKPLMYLFKENRSISHLASARIQRWSLMLAAYDYSVKYRAGKDVPNADALSR